MVTSSDPTKRSTTLRVKANIVGSVQILPRAYIGFPSPPKYSYNTRVLIRKEPSEKGELAITSVATTEPWLKATPHKVEKPEPKTDDLPDLVPGDWLIDVVVSEEAPRGPGGVQLSFQTGLTREPKVVVPISVSMDPALHVMPPSLVMVMPAGNKEMKVPFTVSVRPGLGKEALKATTTADSFSVTVKKDGDNLYSGEAKWKAVGDEPVRNAAIVLTVGGETVNVPVRLLEKPAQPAGAAPAGASGAPGVPGSPAGSPPAVPAGSPPAAAVPAPVPGEAPAGAPAPAQAPLQSPKAKPGTPSTGH